MSELYSKYFPKLREVKELAERFRKYNPSTIREILTSWADRRPIEAPIQVIEEIFVGVRRLRETANSILSYLRERDWRGAIVRIVGEYGSGKTQLGQIMLRALREEGNVVHRFISLDPLTNIRQALMERIDGKDPVVLIIDEVDQLLRDLERGRREKLEDLADVVRLVTEGSYSSPPRGSAILLLSKRAQEALMSDRALANRLMERSRQFRLSMSDEEREKAGIEAVRKILALWMAYDRSYASIIGRLFPAIYPLMVDVARDLALTREIGGIMKNLVDLSEYFLSEVREDASLLSRVDEGNEVESMLREFLTREMRSVPFKVRLGDSSSDYLAVFSTERISTAGAISDGQFVVWTYDPSRGKKGERIVERIGVEVKFGDYWMENRDQILRLLLEHPLLLISITDKDPEELSEVEAEIRRGGRPFAALPVSPSLMRVAYLLRREAALTFIRERGNLERDLPEVLSQLMIPAAISQSVEEAGVDRDSLLRKASSAVLSSIMRELRRTKTYKRISTLSNIIAASIDSVFGGAGIEAPAMSSGTIDLVIRVLVREGLGRLSGSGKSLVLSREARLILDEIERDDDRRRKVELVIYDVLSKGMVKETMIS